MNKIKDIPEFTYDWYVNLIKHLLDVGYSNISYKDTENKLNISDNFILRHDVDNSLTKALEMARLERQLGVKSTFFILLTSDFYNIASSKNKESILEISDLGHDIGLHFDEASYQNKDVPIDVPELIVNESKIMSEILGLPIESVSMHRPSKRTLESNYIIPGIINSYGDRFFKDFKYLSDSRCRWREPINEIVSKREFSNLHILTHPIWYHNSYVTMRQTLLNFIEQASKERYETEKENITDLDSIINYNN